MMRICVAVELGIAKAIKKPNPENTSDNDKELFGTEAQLYELFNMQSENIEPYGMGVKSIPDIEEDDLTRIKEIYLPIFTIASSGQELCNQQNLEISKLLLQLLEEHKREIKDYTLKSYLEDFSTSVDADNEMQGNLYMAIRNLHMLTNIERGLVLQKLPLFVVGADHLIGSLGLINLLRHKGYTITRVGPHKNSNPINYAYDLYKRSYNKVKDEILHGNRGLLARLDI